MNTLGKIILIVIIILSLGYFFEKSINFFNFGLEEPGKTIAKFSQYPEGEAKADIQTSYIQNIPVNIQQEIQKYGATLFFKTMHGNNPAYFLYINNQENLDVFKIVDSILNLQLNKGASIWIYDEKFNSEDISELGNVVDVWNFAAKRSPSYMVNSLGRFYNAEIDKWIGQDTIYIFENNNMTSLFCYKRGAFSNWAWETSPEEINLQDFIY